MELVATSIHVVSGWAVLIRTECSMVVTWSCSIIADEGVN